jgi:integrase
MRPGELDALRLDRIDFQAGTIVVNDQWNAKTATFTPPKHGVTRTIALTDPVRQRLLALPRESEFAFTTLRGALTALYTATRHYFGWFAWNVLELDARDIALHFGHQDGGALVRKLYGHPDAARARDRVRQVFRQALSAPVPLGRSA